MLYCESLSALSFTLTLWRHNGREDNNHISWVVCRHPELYDNTSPRTETGQKRSWRGGKWARMVDDLVSHKNMSQHSIALNIKELLSANKHFKSCFFVLWPKDLTKYELGLFTRRHYDDVVSASFWFIHCNTPIKKLPLTRDRCSAGVLHLRIGHRSASGHPDAVPVRVLTFIDTSSAQCTDIIRSNLLLIHILLMIVYTAQELH